MNATKPAPSKPLQEPDYIPESDHGYLPDVDPNAISTNFFWTLGQHEVFNLQTTVRGVLESEIVAFHLDMVVQTLKDIVAAGGHAKPVGTQPDKPLAQPPAPLPEIGTHIVTPAPAAPAPAPAPAASSPAAPAASSNTFRAVKFEVQPLQGDKVKLMFYSNTKRQPVDRYPMITSTMSLDRAIDALMYVGGWTSEHLTKPNAFTVDWDVTWEQGREYQPGKHYKDITSIQPR